MAQQLDVYSQKGKKVASVELEKKIYDGKINIPLMQQAVNIYLANQRQGTASAKTRAQVSGGGKKPWRQKGTGRARFGSIRTPIWRGGGIVFGPKLRSYRKKFPARMKAAALKSALNAKVKDKEVIVLDKLDLSSGKTKEFAALLDKFKLSKTKVRIVLCNLPEELKRSASNLENISLHRANDLNTYFALDCQKLLIEQEALEILNSRIKKWLN